MAEEVKDGTLEGAPAPSGEQGSTTQSTPPAFDPSKVDPNDGDALISLTDEQIEAVHKFQTATPTPEKAPATDTPPTDTVEKKPAGEPAEKPAGSATVYAGKYTSTDDLLKGVGEIGKKVGADDVAMQVVIAAAQKSGDFSSVETLYKLYESRLGAVAASETQDSTAPGEDTAVDMAALRSDPEVSAQIDSLTTTQLAQSNLAQQMAAKGLALPKNMAEFEILTEVAPYLAMAFQQAYKELFTANLDEAKGYIEAERSLESSNARVMNTDTQSIQDFAKEQGFKLSDAEVAAVKTAALANPANYESRYGHKFLREGALRDQFMITAMPSKLAEIKIAKEAEGRMQAVNDLKNIHRKEVTSIGTSRLTTKTRAAQKMPDLNDPDVVAQLPMAALEDPEGYFKQFTK